MPGTEVPGSLRVLFVRHFDVGLCWTDTFEGYQCLKIINAFLALPNSEPDVDVVLLS